MADICVQYSSYAIKIFLKCLGIIVQEIMAENIWQKCARYLLTLKYFHNDANVLTINYMNMPAKSVLIYYGNLGEVAQKQFSSIYVNVNCYISPRNPLNSDTEVIKVYSPLSRESRAFISAIMASGFTRLPNNFTDDIFHSFLPCPVGTFSNTTSKGKEGCTQCSPGYCYSSV